MHFLYVACTVIFTVYGQMILKWRINELNWTMIEGNLFQKGKHYLELLFDPFILSGFIAAFIASVFWVFAMSKIEITTAYPFMSLSTALVFVLGIFILNETFTVGKVAGLTLIALGTIVTVKF